jgi:hypothetical protein
MRWSVLDIPFDFRSKFFPEIMYEKFNLKANTPFSHEEREEEGKILSRVDLCHTVADQYDSNGSGCLCVTALHRNSSFNILKVWDWKINIQTETDIFAWSNL